MAVADGGSRREAFRLVTALREAGVRAEMEQAGRSLKGQLKHADRLSAKAVAIVGDGLDWKDMKTGEQRSVSNILEAVRIAVGVDA